MPHIFNKLTPKTDIDINDSQADAMNFVISQEDIKNVAISGNYGSGKSSFIETYKIKNKNFKPIHISLAHFSRDQENLDPSARSSEIADTRTNDERQTNILERKIINQLLHKINPKYIPLAIFKPKQNIRKRTILGWGVATIVLFASILFLHNYSDFAEVLTSIFPCSPKIGLISRMTAYILIFFMSIPIICKLVSLQLSQKLFQSISFNGIGVSGKAEMFHDINISYFDKYLDDVLYLFKNCQSNIIVFEDIDRFETNLIFEKLREINILLNQKKEKNDKKFLFIYLLKDDMFVPRERTKFFDFIIPIIPVVTSSNAGERLTDILEKMNLNATIDKKFIRKISIYIDDMRLAYNVCNEFSFYHSMLCDEKQENKLKLDDKKLFSIILYKNIFPKDFSYLQRDSGLIYEIMQKSRQLKAAKIKGLNEKISALKDEIIDAEQEFLENELELYSVFLKVPEDGVALRANGRGEGVFPSRTEFVKEIRSSDASVEYLDKYGGSSSIEDINTLFLTDSSEFQSRLNKIKNKNKLDALNDRLKLLREELNKVSSEKIAQLIDPSVFKSIYEQPEFNYLQGDGNVSMIFFLLKNGYIDEGYSDYITYFYPNSLTKQDKEFLISVQGEDNILSEDYQLSNVSEVYDRLEDSDFSHNCILNYDLLEYSLTKGGSEVRINHYLIEERFEFLNKFLKKNVIELESKITLILNLIKSNQGTLKTLIASDKIIDLDKIYIASLLISSVSIGRDVDPEFKSVLVNFIEEKWQDIQKEIDKVSQLSDDCVSKIQNNLSVLEVRFTNFKFDNSHKSISQYVYENDLYAINMNNIINLIGYLSPTITEELVKDKPISTIGKFDTLSIYIQKNIECYIVCIKQMVLSSSVRINDELSDVYEILNNESISLESRIDYIKCLPDGYIEINQLKNQKIVDVSLQENKVICNTQNLLEAFCKYDGWNDLLVNFVNSKNYINFEKIVFDEYPKEQRRIFFKETVLCNNLNNKHYENFLSVMKWSFNILPEEDIDNEKLNILIEIKVIKFNIETLISLRERYPEYVIQYISNHLDKYTECLDEEIVYDEDEILKILEKKISPRYANLILNYCKSTISIQNKNYSNLVIGYILEKRFDKGDLPYILFEYSKFTKGNKNKIFNISHENIKDIVSNQNLALDKTLLIRLISADDVEANDKKVLLSRQLSIFNIQDLSSILKSADLLEFYTNLLDDIDKNRKPKLEINEVNQNILEYLKVQNKISSYKEGRGYYRVYGKKNNK